MSWQPQHHSVQELVLGFRFGVWGLGFSRPPWHRSMKRWHVSCDSITLCNLTIFSWSSSCSNRTCSQSHLDITLYAPGIGARGLIVKIQSMRAHTHTHLTDQPAYEAGVVCRNFDNLRAHITLSPIAFLYA